MYLQYFSLAEPPFSIAPDPRYLYMSAQHQEALAHLLYGVGSDGGFVLLTGEVGTGKTTVCRCLLEQLPAETDVAFIYNPKLTSPELLATICNEFHVELPPGTDSIKVLVDLLNAYLLDAHARGRRSVLIIDEAQNLSPDVLEQLRLLTNLETSQRKLLQIILLGQPELQTLLQGPELRQLAQRIVARYHLRPLNREEVGAYVQHRLALAGGHRRLIPDSLTRRLHRMSNGVPRLINLLCDRALLGAFVQGRDGVDRATLRKAAREVFGEKMDVPGGERRSTRVLHLVGGLALGAVLAVGLWYYLGAPREIPASLESRSVPLEPIPMPSADTAGMDWTLPAQNPLTAVSAGTALASAAQSPNGSPPAADTDRSLAGEQTATAGADSTDLTLLANLPSPASPVAAAGIDSTATQPPAAVERVGEGTETPASSTAAAISSEPAESALESAGEHTAAAGTAGPVTTSVADQPAKAGAADESRAAPGSPTSGPPPEAETVAMALALPPAVNSAEAQADAYAALFDQWGKTFDPAANPCEQATATGLRCLSDRGGLDDLRRLNLPVILNVATEPGRTRPITVASLAGETGTIVVDGKAQEISLTALAGRWNGEYTLLWRAPPHYAGALQVGAKSLVVPWLRSQLAKISDGTSVDEANLVFDQALAAKVSAFQVSEGLVPDGIAGPLTLIRLLARTDASTPRLTKN